MRWNSKADPIFLERYGATRLYMAFYEPPDEPGGMMQIPIPIHSDDEFRMALHRAIKGNMIVVFLCDEPVQVRQTAAFVNQYLPKWKRVALERGQAILESYHSECKRLTLH